MSWFNASHLSTFAKQALTTAQKSIDRVLDIKEEDQWGNTTIMPYDGKQWVVASTSDVRNYIKQSVQPDVCFSSDITVPGKLSVSGGWGMTQWEAPAEEETITPPASSEAITTPVTRTVVDETDNFFSAFLSPGDTQTVTKTKVVSVPPAKSQRRPQEKEKPSETAVLQVQKDEQIERSVEPADTSSENQTVADKEPEETKSSSTPSSADTIFLHPVSPVSSPSDLPFNNDSKPSSVKIDNDSSVSVESKTEQPDTCEYQPEDTTNSPEPSPSEAKSCTPSDPSPSTSSKEVLSPHKDTKAEDRQNDTPSPPVSAFSSGTSTTSDIEVLDHESVLSESSASSRQETGESKTGLHLMQGSFQLLTASACGDFPRLEDYPKLTESCGSSSDAFERIDSFSVQSLDSRSVSEVNSDDEIPGSQTLASVTAAGPASLTESCPKQEDVSAEEVGEDREEEEEDEEGEEEVYVETARKLSLDEMEESGRSATPVNSEQPEELADLEDGNVAQFDSTSEAEERSAPPITEEMRSVSTVQILEFQKVTFKVEL